MRTNCFSLIFLCAICCTVGIAQADVELKPLEYHDRETTLAGFLAMPGGKLKTPRPGIVVFSDWMGVGDFSKERAKRLAEAGYIALAADIYGAGIRPKDAKEAGILATQYKKERDLLRERAKAALLALQAIPGVDQSRVAAIGFCFGGTAALELARTGAPLAGVVSFHGGLETPDPALARNIKAKLLILHGAEDPLVPATEVQAFEDEMMQAKVDWQLVKYSGAVHAFTNPMAGNDPTKGVAYDASADKRSYQAMTDFFKEIFGR
jgi:dienelactone hydrolase